MDDPEFKKSGIRDTLGRLGDSILGLFQNRLQLLSVELQEEKCRWIRLGIWLGAVAALVIVALAMCVLTLAVIAWQVGELKGLIGLSVTLLLAAWIGIWQFNRRFRQGPTPFSATMDEFRKDREWLRGKH